MHVLVNCLSFSANWWARRSTAFPANKLESIVKTPPFDRQMKEASLLYNDRQTAYLIACSGMGPSASNSRVMHKVPSPVT